MVAVILQVTGLVLFVAAAFLWLGAPGAVSAGAVSAFGAGYLLERDG